jgi:Domain of unknown function (DUF4340)
MKPRTLLILFLLVAGLGAWVWFVERKLPGTKERAEAAKKLLTLKADEVTGLVLEGENRTVKLTREEEKGGEEKSGGEAAPAAGAKWRLEEPLAAPADAGQVRTFVDSLIGLDKQRTLDEFDAKELGLDKPRAKVTLQTEDGPQVIEVGAEVPSSDSMVVTLAGGKAAYVVPDSIYKDIVKDPGDWRDKNLFRGERADVQSIRVTPAGSPGVLLSRRGKEFWLESPIADRANRDDGDRLLSDLVNLRATHFVDASKSAADLGLESPAGVLEVVLKGQEKPFEVAVGKLTSEGATSRYVRAGGQLAEVATDLGRWLDKKPADWRSLSWASLESWEVEGASIADAQGTVKLARKGTDWERDGTKIEYTPISDLLTAVTGAEATSLADQSPAGPPSLTLTLQASGGSEETLTLFPPAADGVPAKAQGRDAVLLLPPDKAAKVTAAVAAVRAAKPLPEKKDEKPADVKVDKQEGDGEPPP